jgi:drug/metabolite transporter (DMT)-like permease
MVVGVAAISTSPILIRVAALPALALAFWRCLAGAALLAPFASRHRGGALARADLARLAAAGVCLAAHFALWNASLGLTTVAAATTLVSSAPLFVGLGSIALGEAPSTRAWAGIGLATAGAVVIGVGDAAGLGGGPNSLWGDVLAFAGALAMAAYLLLGRVARQRLPVSTYAASVYAVAAAALLPACLLTGSSLGGYQAASWLALAGVVVGPQLLGHTVIATVGAWWLFGERPGASLWAGAPMVLAGVWLATTGSRRM